MFRATLFYVQIYVYIFIYINIIGQLYKGHWKFRKRTRCKKKKADFCMLYFYELQLHLEWEFFCQILQHSCQAGKGHNICSSLSSAMLPLQRRICRSVLTFVGKYHLSPNSLARKQIIQAESPGWAATVTGAILWSLLQLRLLLVKTGEKNSPASCKCSRSLLHRAEHEASAVILKYSLTVNVCDVAAWRSPEQEKASEAPVCGKRNVLDGAIYKCHKK